MSLDACKANKLKKKIIHNTHIHTYTERHLHVLYETQANTQIYRFFILSLMRVSCMPNITDKIVDVPNGRTFIHVHFYWLHAYLQMLIRCICGSHCVLEINHNTKHKQSVCIIIVIIIYTDSFVYICEIYRLLIFHLNEIQIYFYSSVKFVRSHKKSVWIQLWLFSFIRWSIKPKQNDLNQHNAIAEKKWFFLIVAKPSFTMVRFLFSFKIDLWK